MAQDEKKKKVWVVELAKDPELKKKHRRSQLFVGQRWTDILSDWFTWWERWRTVGWVFFKTEFFISSWRMETLFIQKVGLLSYSKYWMLNKFKNFCKYSWCLTLYSYPQRDNNLHAELPKFELETSEAQKRNSKKRRRKTIKQ